MTAIAAVGRRWDQLLAVGLLFLGELLANLVIVARRRRAGLDTYWRLSLHRRLGIVLISVLVKYALRLVFGVPTDLTTGRSRLRAEAGG